MSAAVTAIDKAAQQPRTARRLAAVHGVEVRWLHRNAERVPLADATVDFAVSEYGRPL